MIQLNIPTNKCNPLRKVFESHRYETGMLHIALIIIINLSLSLSLISKTCPHSYSLIRSFIMAGMQLEEGSEEAQLSFSQIKLPSDFSHVLKKIVSGIWSPASILRKPLTLLEKALVVGLHSDNYFFHFFLHLLVVESRAWSDCQHFDTPKRKKHKNYI